MTDSQRNLNLNSFRNGNVPVLVCTKAAEEGIDVSACQVVIRFSSFNVSKSHIQGSGRARALNSRIFYFENNPSEEIVKANSMFAVARNPKLSLSPGEMKAGRRHHDIEDVHPFFTDLGAKVDIFNATEMVCTYWNKTMHTAFNAESFYVYISAGGLHILETVMVPSPDGFIPVTRSDVDDHWQNFAWPDVVGPARMKKYSPTEWEARRFIFVVAVTLSEKGHLDANNKPSTRALNETRSKCPVQAIELPIKIGMKYDPRGLELTANPNIDTENYKGRLNEETGGAVTYTTVQVDGGFQTSVNVLDRRVKFQGDAKATKKAAEQSAAQIALSTLPLTPTVNSRGLELTANPSAATTAVVQSFPQPQHSTPLARDLPTAAGTEDPSSSVAANYKGKLNEETRGAVTYTTVQIDGGFQTSVNVLDHRVKFQGDVKATKKAAEQSAAQNALLSLPSAPNVNPSGLDSTGTLAWWDTIGSPTIGR